MKMNTWKPSASTHGRAKDHAPACCEEQAVAPAIARATGRNGGIEVFWPVSDPLQHFFF